MDPTSLLLLGLMIVVFYVLLIRPQQKRLKQHQALVAHLEMGDEVITIGGMYGKVRRMDDTHIWLEVADGVVLRFARQAISRKPEELAGNDAAKQVADSSESEPED